MEGGDSIACAREYVRSRTTTLHAHVTRMNGDSRFGDMAPRDLQRHGAEVFEWIARFLASPEEFPVLSRARPGAVRSAFPAAPPEEGVAFERILETFETAIIPGITHWNHPGFMAYFATSGSGPGILAETLCAALNVNAMLWRTSPSATELEEVAIDWLRQLVGLPDAFRGHIQDTASTSTMVALAAARESAGIDVRTKGLFGADRPRLTIYCSEEAHSSVEKAAITLGLGLEAVRRVPTDENHAMRMEPLAKSLAEDIDAGARPMAVVATVGTTSTTAIDPVDEVAAVCRRHGVWLHVDAAYAGSAAVVPELRAPFSGWEHADSIVINPHKWLFVPLDCSALFLRDPELVKRAFAVLPEYLRTPEGDGVINLMEYGPALGRRFRALKLWTTLTYFGRRGLAERISEHVRLARLLGSWIDDTPDWERRAPVPFSTVCFRYVPTGLTDDALDELNADLLEEVNRSGSVFCSHTRVRGRYTIRIAIGNIRTDERWVERAWEAMQSAASKVMGARDF